MTGSPARLDFLSTKPTYGGLGAMQCRT